MTAAEAGIRPGLALRHASVRLTISCSVMYFRDRIWPEDSPAMTKQQRGMKSRGYQQGRLMVDTDRTWRSEHAVHHFDKQVWEALNGKSYG